MTDELSGHIEQAKTGDRAALDRVLERVQDRLRAVASARLSRMLRTKMRTSDLLQSTYVDVVRHIGDFRGDDEETFVVWVTRIMENNLRDQVKFFGRSKRQEPDAQVADPETEAGSDLTPSRKAIQIESLVSVSRALERLPADQREVIVLRLIEGKEFAEIADVMDKKEGAVRMMLMRARAALALEMERLADED